MRGAEGLPRQPPRAAAKTTPTLLAPARQRPDDHTRCRRQAARPRSRAPGHTPPARTGGRRPHGGAGWGRGEVEPPQRPSAAAAKARRRPLRARRSLQPLRPATGRDRENVPAAPPRAGGANGGASWVRGAEGLPRQPPRAAAKTTPTLPAPARQRPDDYTRCRRQAARPRSRAPGHTPPARTGGRRPHGGTGWGRGEVEPPQQPPAAATTAPRGLPPPPQAGMAGHRARLEKRPRSPPARRGGERGSELGSGGGRLTSATASGGREDLGARGVITLGPCSSPLEPAHSRPRLAAPAPAPRGSSPTSRPVGGVPSPTRRKRARDTAQAGPCPLSDTHPHSDRRPSRLDPKRPRLTSTQGRHSRPYDYG